MNYRHVRARNSHPTFFLVSRSFVFCPCEPVCWVVSGSTGGRARTRTPRDSGPLLGTRAVASWEGAPWFAANSRHPRKGENTSS
ncbi:hypothetical protein GQ607_011252 [Colletotrichum asianum]|uniref:Uncharacterized protein n=1 Tax=Colletotrichum asianum TaxID=702518 RepID=A0A8H3W8X5_9PEZI|nr:hypothetical protein GQ607_011252 [Colletotrichum asianum]